MRPSHYPLLTPAPLLEAGCWVSPVQYSGRAPTPFSGDKTRCWRHVARLASTCPDTGVTSSRVPSGTSPSPPLLLLCPAVYSLELKVMIFGDKHPNFTLLIVFKCLVSIVKAVKALVGAFSKEKALAGVLSRKLKITEQRSWCEVTPSFNAPGCCSCCELPWDCGGAASSRDTDQAEYISRGLATSDLYQEH